ncbi:hypothetical protein B4N89_30375 [Embleya scabrispora]|uniref:Uncharacterized protein n=1 Tax=Embleya scabrispora TaxID=159449 RepID=A0A1T3P6I1_9ACTN|nr:hypothetical protein [Embleya scabrispora]OPC84653.1 hypothetical protein B4N89_30375 [Embleya scabrispora]
MPDIRNGRFGRRLLALVLAAVATLAVGPSPAVGAASASAAPPGSEEVSQTQRGRRLSDGTCRFTESGSGSAGSARSAVTTTVVETAYDAATCTRTTVSRTRTDAVKAATRTDPTAHGTGTASHPAPWTLDLRVAVVDPLGIEVTATDAALEWAPDPQRGLTSRHHSDWNWFTPSGWTRTAHDQHHTNDGISAATDTTGAFRNDVFCLTITTFTNHPLTRVEGRSDGSWRWSHNVDKSGGCNELLHYSRTLTTP